MGTTKRKHNLTKLAGALHGETKPRRIPELFVSAVDAQPTSGTGIATVFVDQQLHILRFTPTASRLVNLFFTDVGRPVGHIVSNLKDYDHLGRDGRPDPKEALKKASERSCLAMVSDLSDALDLSDETCPRRPTTPSQEQADET